MKLATPAPSWAQLFLPFALGYFLSYLYRTANAVIGPVLATELQLADNALGLLTSTYFLAFGAAQIPLGILLDRFGPRRVEAGLLVIGALGTFVFSQATDLVGLASGRALIGLGVAACLMASLKAFSMWFSADKQASLVGWVMAAGGLGALAAAKPLAWGMNFVSWREICVGLAVLTLITALVIFFVVPEKPSTSMGAGGIRAQLSGVKDVLRSRHFWRYAPMGFWFTGGFMAVQGLWASRWMSVIEGLDASQIADRLGWLSLAMLGGFLFMGFFAGRLVRRGISLDTLYRLAMSVSIVDLAVLSLNPGIGEGWLWAILGACFSLSNICYGLVAQAFPSTHSGRANTAANLFIFLGAFGLQWGIGVLTDLLQAHDWQARDAYQVVFWLLVLGQILALVWLFASKPKTVSTVG